MKKSILLLLICTTQILLAKGNTGSFTGTFLVDGQPAYKVSGQLADSGAAMLKTSCIADLNGNPVILEKACYNPESFTILALDMCDTMTGKHEKISKLPEGYRVQYRKNHTACWSEKTLSHSDPLIHGSVVAMFLVDHLDEIQTKGSIEFPMVVSGQMAVYQFTARICGEQQKNCQTCLDIIIEPVSWLVRQFAPPIHFYIDTRSPHLLQGYTGPLAPSDLEGNKLVGEILFYYN